jgi:hypothetical protein
VKSKILGAGTFFGHCMLYVNELNYNKGTSGMIPEYHHTKDTLFKVLSDLSSYSLFCVLMIS